MVARSYFLSLLALATAFGSAIAVAAPQDDETAPPLNELEAVPVDFDAPGADARPVPGAESNTLLEAAPELGALADAVPNPEVTKRDVSILSLSAPSFHSRQNFSWEEVCLCRHRC